jgi:hypothetical protein
MKFRTTLYLFIAFVVLLAFFFLSESVFKKEKQEDKLVNREADEVTEIILTRGEETIRFLKENEEDWLIKEPITAAADRYEVNRLADDFSNLRVERVVEETPTDLQKYGLPNQEIILKFKDNTEVKIEIGDENPLDKTLFAKRSDEERVVLLPSYIKTVLEKKLIDFRKKDIFSFETDEVKEISVDGPQTKWRAEKREDEWWLVSPVESLAQSSKISNILYSLSSLKAKEFLCEDKKAADLKKYGLQKPQYQIRLKLPQKEQEFTVYLTKKDDTLYATSTLSAKIISADDTIISDLEKKIDELREKEVAVFYTWEVKELKIKKEGLVISLKKNKDNDWIFEPSGEKADNEKVESFIRQLDSLEAESFIDPPFNLQDFGLEKPLAEISLVVEAGENKTKEITLKIGQTQSSSDKAYLQNTRLNYLLVVKSDFLDQLPHKKEDWQPQALSEKTEEKKG